MKMLLFVGLIFGSVGLASAAAEPSQQFTWAYHQGLTQLLRGNIAAALDNLAVLRAHPGNYTADYYERKLVENIGEYINYDLADKTKEGKRLARQNPGFKLFWEQQH